jgi:hypothetical protein
VVILHVYTAIFHSMNTVVYGAFVINVYRHFSTLLACRPPLPVNYVAHDSVVYIEVKALSFEYHTL